MFSVKSKHGPKDPRRSRFTSRRSTMSPAIRLKSSIAANALLGSVVSVVGVAVCLVVDPFRWRNTLNVWLINMLDTALSCVHSGNLWLEQSRKNTPRRLRSRHQLQLQYPGWSNKENYVSPPWSHVSRAEEAETAHSPAASSWHGEEGIHQWLKPFSRSEPSWIYKV